MIRQTILPFKTDFKKGKEDASDGIKWHTTEAVRWRAKKVNKKMAY